jgi:hypothetical protein
MVERLKSTLLAALLVTLVMLLSSCFYLRLQQVKNQLARFDQYYEIKEGRRFSITAKEPVLLPDDVVRIMKTPPSRSRHNEPDLVFDYTLQKQYPAGDLEAKNYDITVTFVFENDKLANTLIDQRFFAVIPKQLFITIVKAFGNAKVDIGKRHISAWSADTGEIHIPDVNEIIQLLGKPYSRDGRVHTYKYLRKLPPQFEPNEPDLLDAFFTFDDKDNLIKCKSEFLGALMEVDFSPLYNYSEQQKSTSDDSEATQQGQQP